MAQLKQARKSSPDTFGPNYEELKKRFFEKSGEATPTMNMEQIEEIMRQRIDQIRASTKEKQERQKDVIGEVEEDEELKAALAKMEQMLDDKLLEPVQLSFSRK